MTNKYDLYELAVQSPEEHVDLFESICRQMMDRPARVMREDFCGTFRLSTAWVKSSESRRAVAIDLDPEPLRIGRAKNRREKLPAAAARRLSVLRQDVLTARTARADLTVACNFSFYILKRRQELLRYFKRVRANTAPGGVFILEMSGGPGLIERTRERKTVREGAKRFVYVWDQKSFDPITRGAKFAIHFEIGKKKIRDAFTYDWRLWTIPEVRDLLSESGFKSTQVFWETSHRGEGTGEFVFTEKGDNSYSWIAYVVARK